VNGFVLEYVPEGPDLAGLITLKVNAIFLALSALLGSSTVNQVLHALAHLKLPSKLVTLFMLFYRYLHLLDQEYRRLRQAMTVRGFIPKTNLHTYRSYARLVAMLLVRSVDRSERVYQAMLCRGFSGTFWLLDHFVWRRADSLFCALSGLALGALTVLQWGSICWN
jgi:cobalt/nickel transport system permease protein